MGDNRGECLSIFSAPSDSYSTEEQLSNRHVSDFVFTRFSLSLSLAVLSCFGIDMQSDKTIDGGEREDDEDREERDASAFLILSVTTINILIIGDSSGKSGSFR